MKTPIRKPSHWQGPIDSICTFLRDPCALRLEELQWSGSGIEQRTAYHHLMQIIRNRDLIHFLVSQHAQRPPRTRLQALLALAVVQMLEDPEDEGTHAKIVHHTVQLTRELCSERESKFVNAMGRAIAQRLRETLRKLETPSQWHTRYSHPKWLVDRWRSHHGSDATRLLLQWNQRIPKTYVHDVHGLLDASSDEAKSAASLGLTATQWSGFFELEKQGKGHLEALMKDPFYIQDPSTRLAPALFDTTRGCERILDACAAPGGKSLHLSKRLGDAGKSWQRWIAADLTQDRIDLLQSNLTRLQLTGIETCCVNWLETIPESLATLRFDWVLLDAPCTSAGVIQRHPEIRWRLRPEDYTTLPERQRHILQECSRLVKPGGQLVFSTCSIDPDENQHVVESFLKSDAGNAFTQTSGSVVLPHEAGHDGIGAFLLRRQG